MTLRHVIVAAWVGGWLAVVPLALIEVISSGWWLVAMFVALFVPLYAQVYFKDVFADGELALRRRGFRKV